MHHFERPFGPPYRSIGLFGGSFDPAHDGHMHLTREAIKRCGFDQVWWLVSPSNPLKTNDPKALDERIAFARKRFRHPKVKVCDLERKLGTRFTADTISQLQRLYPRCHFTWLMGADNLVNFHHWDRWQEVVRSTPMAVFARPEQRLPALNAKAARIYRSSMVNEAAAATLKFRQAPAWCFINMPMKTISSTDIRARKDW